VEDVAEQFVAAVRRRGGRLALHGADPGRTWHHLGKTRGVLGGRGRADADVTQDKRRGRKHPPERSHTAAKPGLPEVRRHATSRPFSSPAASWCRDVLSLTDLKCRAAVRHYPGA
jgi:hypothetical protein